MATVLFVVSLLTVFLAMAAAWIGLKASKVGPQYVGTEPGTLAGSLSWQMLAAGLSQREAGRLGRIASRLAIGTAVLSAVSVLGSLYS